MTQSAFAPARCACAAVLIALLAACVGSQPAAAQSKSLRIGYTAVPANIPVVVAQKKGFYAKYGLDVKLTPNTASGTQLPSIGKQWDVLVATPANVVQYAYKGGDPLVLNVGIIDTPQTLTPNLIVEKGITSLKQLKGKTIGVIGIGSGNQWVSAFIAFERAGVDVRKDVKFLEVPFANQLDNLRAHRIDAALATEPYIGQMRAAGYGGLTNTYLSVTKTAVGTMYVTRKSVAKKDPKKFRAFQKAYTEAANYCKANREECFQQIVETFGTNINAARRTAFERLQPKAKNSYVTDWIRPMERVKLLKKGKLKKTRNFIFK